MVKVFGRGYDCIGKGKGDGKGRLVIVNSLAGVTIFLGLNRKSSGMGK